VINQNSLISIQRYLLGIGLPKCEYCGVEVNLPFQCNYCEKYFCEAHRLLENHSCPNAPPRTPLGSYQSKQLLANVAKKVELDQSIMFSKTETKTYGNIFNHLFSVSIETYSDEKYREKLDKARTLDDVEKILHDYRKHHPKK
jgi:hypothetical protein